MSKKRIYRKRVVQESITVPDGFQVCPSCEGQGMMSKYDMGWSSLAHNEELAAPRTCYRCAGKGMVPDE